MAEKEEYAIVLDYLPYGYPLEKKMMSIAQAIGLSNLTLLQLVPRRGVKLELKEKVYIGDGKRDKIYYILGRLPHDKLTETAKIQIQEFIGSLIKEQEKRFVDFFNTAEAINTRLHQIELLPGFGKKHMHAVLEERKKSAFKDFEDLKKRIPNLPDPKRAIEKRLIQELETMERHNLFIK